MILQDLLELIYTVTRLKSVPALRDSQELPEAERTRGAALAEQLSVPVLARAWQMLLKGVGEVETAPDRRAAAEMVLIRLCHVSDMPPPGDLVRRLGNAPAPIAAPPAPVVPAPRRRRSRCQSAAAPIAVDRARHASSGDLPRCHRAGGERREAMLHAHLIHSVHLVRFAPPVIELRPKPEAPKDLASRLGALLSEVTGTRWTIALSTAAGRTDRRRTGQCRRHRAPRRGGGSPAGARDHGCVPWCADRHRA